MIVKKHRNKNEYCYAGSGLWVRDFTKNLVRPFDINGLIPEQDMALLLENEVENHKRTTQQVDTEGFDLPNLVIVSDGYNFTDAHKLLEGLPGVTVLGVNGALVRWQAQRRLNFYVINNPYPEGMRFLPGRAVGWPRCIASTRTYPLFLEKYQGVQYQYTPVSDQNFNGMSSECEYFIDDYRNPVCAAIGLAYRFKVRKLLLLCCAEAFGEERPGAEKLPSGLYAYPQQRVANELIDANLYWLTTKGVKTASHPGGVYYKNAPYINSDEVASFFGAD